MSGSDTPLLEVRNIEAGYGASQVLFGVSLSIAPHQVVSLMGRNGMGKSTTIKCITGALPVRKGQIFFEGKEITNLPADEISRRGIALVPEGRMCFPNLTVKEHLIAFARKPDRQQETAWDLQRIYELFPRLKEREHHMGNQLSGGEQQMLAIGRALSTNPKLLILDEATEGLAPVVREEIWECLANLKKNGQTILIIDKFVNKIEKISDVNYIVSKGDLKNKSTMTETLKATDVFKPQGVPTFTLVKDFGKNLESDDEDFTGESNAQSEILPTKIELFQDAIDEGGKLIRVIGPSKSGKTVFVATMAEKSTIVRVSASGVSSAGDLWSRILSVLGKAYDSLISTEAAGKVGGEFSTKGSAGIVFAKVEGEAKVILEGSLKRISEKIKFHDPINSLIENVAHEKIWIFIDDFHYADANVQRQLAEQIKFASEEGVQFIMALIPGRSEDILKKNDDLRGRIVDIKFSYWDFTKLEIIAKSGFPLLGINVDPSISKKLAIESAGSPQLMQSICLNIARELGARDGRIDPPVNFEMTDILALKLQAVALIILRLLNK